MILIKYRSGLVIQGVVLSFRERLVRVALQDADDAAEFRLIDSVWVSEDCEIVRLEFAGEGATVEIHGDDFLDAMLTVATAPLPVQRVM